MIKYSDFYEQFIVILPKENDYRVCVINKFDTLEMAKAYEASQLALKEQEKRKKEYWWEKEP